jgi:predicted ABC-type transport system involved in lysophospholipase L1 biosynthesis ATPase subunit
MSLPLVRAENLRKVFPSGSAEIVVLASADFEIHAGESVALVGESGAGKTTLLYMLGALDEPTSGEIYFDSKPLSKRTEKELASFRNGSIGYVWQNYHLLPEFSAIENVMMPLLIANQDRAAAETAALKWLADVGLADRATHQAGELSGGEHHGYGAFAARHAPDQRRRRHAQPGLLGTLRPHPASPSRSGHRREAPPRRRVADPALALIPYFQFDSSIPTL